ncbi:transcription factor HES-2 isoform X3 [Mirounga angustirostris]|uniref:transcription factor HES-2 isoform X3 n=1 Tax=Mirounga angustirostris TaxID=9716 RepID=UPI00313E79AA
MGLPRRAGDPAELRKPRRASAEPEAAAGEAPPRAHQRKPEAAQGAHPAAAGQGGQRLVLTAVCGRAVSFVRVSAPLPRGRAQSSHCSKLEKADILEMTVRFLQELPASSCAATAPTPSDSYGEGYRACLARLARVLPACRVLEPAVSARLLEHLRRRAAGATPDGARAGDSCGAAAPSPPPAPAPAPPAPPRGPGLWRPW